MTRRVEGQSPIARSALMEYIGVDGCRFGWVSVGLSQCGVYEIEKFTEFRQLLKHYPHARLVLVDIPICLPQGPGGRDCDREARRKLGARGPTVFPTPTRQTVQQAARSTGDYKASADLEQGITGKRVNRPGRPNRFAASPWPERWPSDARMSPQGKCRAHRVS